MPTSTATGAPIGQLDDVAVREEIDLEWLDVGEGARSAKIEQQDEMLVGEGGHPVPAGAATSSAGEAR